MKRRIGAGILAAAVLFLAAGCGGKDNSDTKEPVRSTETETVLEELILAAEKDAQQKVMAEEYAEKTELPELAAFLTDYYQIPEEYLPETRYYYNYRDLNGDGAEEMIVLTIGESTSTSSGECVLVLSGGTEFTVIGDFRNARTPVVVSEEKTNGWYDLIYPVYGGGQDTGYLRCTYQGENGYQCSEENFLEKLEGISGSKVLANNLIDDMDKGNYMTLAPAEEEK